MIWHSSDKDTVLGFFSVNKEKGLEKETAEGKNAGISGTPTFVINGKKVVGAQPFDNFKKEIDAILAK